VDNVENLSTKNVDKLDITACFVESVDKLSTLFGDNFCVIVWLVDNVENLSTKNVDKSDNAACFVKSVDNLSTMFGDKWK